MQTFQGVGSLIIQYKQPPILKMGIYNRDLLLAFLRQFFMTVFL